MPRSVTKKANKTKTTLYDVAEHLRTPEEMAAYLDAWLEEAPDDAAGIAGALGNIARAKGMTQVAKDAGLSRESLYRALSAEGNPSFATVLKVAKALGVKLHAKQRDGSQGLTRPTAVLIWRTQFARKRPPDCQRFGNGRDVWKVQDTFRARL